MRSSPENTAAVGGTDASPFLVAHLVRTLLTITSFVLVLTALAQVERASAE